MHHYIYQISECPIPEDDWVSDYDFMNRPDLLPMADAIDPAEDRSYAIRELGGWLERNQLGTLSDTSIVLHEGAAARHFEGRFPAFQENAAALRALTEQQFIHNQLRIEFLIDNIRIAFCNPFCPHLLPDKNARPVTMDEFIRTAKPGTHYYIGGVLDYHC